MPDTREIKIGRAEYGILGMNLVDVQPQIEKLINNGSLSLSVSPQSIGIADPAPGVIKTLILDGLIVTNGDTKNAVPVSISKNDGEQVSINPKIEEKKAETGPFDQIQNSIWYGIVALIGTYMAYSIYYIGAKGIGYSVIGSLLAMYVAYLFMKAAFSTSGTLFGVVISIPLQIIFWVYVYSLFYPNSINFDYSQPALPSQ